MEETSESPSTSATQNLTDLNFDSISHCLKFISPTDVVNLALACRTLRSAVYSDNVWRRLYAERWPYQCIPSGAEGFRELYVDRITAVNQLKFLDPVGKTWPESSVPFSHIILTKNEVYTAQGSALQKLKVDSAEITSYNSGTRRAHVASITCMRLVPTGDVSLFGSALQNEDNVLFTSSCDRTIRIWCKGRSYRTLKGHCSAVTTLADTLLGDCGSKVLASGGEDCTVRIWSLNRKNQSTTFGGNKNPVSLLSVARHKSSLLVSMTIDARLSVWDVSSNSSGSSSCVGMVGFSGTPCGLKCHDAMCYVAAGSSVIAVDIRTMQKVFTAATLSTKIESFEMLPSEWSICTGGENKALIWDIRKAQSEPTPIYEMGHKGKVTKIHMDAFKIVTGGPSDPNIHVWETATGVLANKLDCRPPGACNNPGLSDMAVDGCRIVTSSMGRPGKLYFRDFSNCSEPASSSSSSHEGSGSKFWKFQSDYDVYDSDLDSDWDSDSDSGSDSDWDLDMHLIG